jgi:hypothetical protein
MAEAALPGGAFDNMIRDYPSVRLANPRSAFTDIAKLAENSDATHF